MQQIALFVLFWGSYAAWLTLFAWIAWRGKIRLLLVLSPALLLTFAAIYTHVDRVTAAPKYSHDTDMGYGLVILFAAAVLLLPLAVAIVVYPVGRLWAR